MTEAPRRLSLRARLAIAFVAVAVAAVAALAVVMLAATRSETGRLSADSRAQIVAQVTEELARAYQAAGSWEGADFSGALALAQGADAILIVRDGRGAVVGGGHFGRGPQAGRGAAMTAVTRTIDVGGVRAGTAELRFRGDLTRAEALLRDNLVRAALIGSAIAVAIALAGAALVSRRLAEPLHRLTRAARQLQSGDLDARVGTASAPGELGELSQAFDGMADALARQERARSRLASELAHELRTPVTILRGNLEELIDGDEQPTPARLGSLHEEALRLGSLVEQLDVLARAEAPVATLDREPVDLSRLVAAQLEALAPQLDAKRLTIERRLDPVLAEVDRARLGQVLANLLANALKFTPVGGRIAVAVGQRDGAARIEVADSGPGIPDDELPHVFERFWRGRAGGAVGGRGLGLAVVDDIVRAHGGSVAVANDPASGARFAVTLPQSAPTPLHRSLAAPASRTTSKAMRSAGSGRRTARRAP
jgi:two-component system sensor histidine kinase BaeS